MTFATRLSIRLAADGGWRDTTVKIPGDYIDVLTGQRWSQAVTAAELFATYPVALLAPW
jgi:(1->4)-alpha-D-glucan 1-alpha-D-glucosylmutase